MSMPTNLYGQKLSDVWKKINENEEYKSPLKDDSNCLFKSSNISVFGSFSIICSKLFGNICPLKTK